MNPSPAIRAALKGHDPSDEQWAAITHAPVPVVVVAGAGSGKTAVMAARMVWMTEEGIARPSQILGLTFTNKAAGELEERIESAFHELEPHPQEEPYIATYHSFADRLVRDHGVRIGIDPEVGLLTEAQRWQVLLREFDSLPPFDAVDSRSTSSICRTALSLADQCANHLVTPERVVAEDERILLDPEQFGDDVVLASRRRMEIARVVRAYMDAKDKARRIDFGDQVTKAVELLERFEDLTAELRERYPAILLDEYQDTNVAQRRLMQLLAPYGHNITAVGDARQNIFQWRGSTLFNLIDFPRRHFLRKGGGTHEFLPLSINYRCGDKILQVANRLIDEVPVGRRPGKPLTAYEHNGEGYVAVKLLADQYEEALFIAEEVQRLHEPPPVDGDAAEGIQWGEFAVLVRRKAHISRIYDALNKRGIPVEVVGLGGLLQVPEVMDTVAWLRVIADPGPSGNRWLARLLLGPRFRIHYRDLALLARWAIRHTIELTEEKRGKAEEGTSTIKIINETEFEPDDVAYSLAESLDHLDEIENLIDEVRARLERIRSDLASLRPKAGGPLLELVQAVVAETGISEALEATDRGSSRGNLSNFLGTVAGFAPVSGEPSLGAFLAYLDAAEEIDETLDLATPAASDSVKLMTVHQAKGLEFEVVFIPGVAARQNAEGEKVESVFPDTRTSNPMTSYGQLPHSVREDAEHLPNPWLADGRPKKKIEFAKELRERAIEDERRLFYVALTRAKQRLYVTAAWWYERQIRPKGPSQFFQEVAEAPETEQLPSAEEPQKNPLIERLLEMAVWPPLAHPSVESSDSVFVDGYAADVERLQDGGLSAAGLLSKLGTADRERAEALLAEHRKAIEGLRSPDLGEQVGDRFSSLSATNAIDLASGRLDLGELLRPLPSRPTDARRIGTEIHRWIEETARGLTGLADEEALDEPSAPVASAKLEQLRMSFRNLGFHERAPAKLDTGEPMTELKFVLKLGNRLLRGRIDAVYSTETGLEIVDFKTGAVIEGPDIDQLALYAGALARLPIEIAGTLKLTYCYLATEEMRSREMSVDEALMALEQLEARLEQKLVGT